jgi:hypothetical protein
MRDVSGDFELGMEFFCLEKNTCCFVRASEVSGTKGMLGSSDVWIGFGGFRD